MYLVSESCSVLYDNHIVFDFLYYARLGLTSIMVFSDTMKSYFEEKEIDFHSRQELQKEIHRLSDKFSIKLGAIAMETYTVSFADDKKQINFDYRGNPAEDFCTMTKSDDYDIYDVDSNIRNQKALLSNAKGYIK